MDNKKIEKAATSSGDAEQSHSIPDQYPATHRRSPLIAVLVTLGVLAVAVAGFWWLVWTSSVFDKPADALTFITGGALTLALLIVAIVQACVYWSQRNKMQDSLALTDRIINKMQGQLDAMKDQGLLMDQSLLESQKLALQAEKTAFFSGQQTEMLQLQANALTTQAEIMAHSVLQTKQLVEQNERAVKAAEESSQIANKNMIYAQRAYVNIVGGRMLGANEDGFNFVVKNCGHTPANNVQVHYTVDVGNLPPDLPSDCNWEAVGVLAPDGTYDIAAHPNRVFTTEEQNLRKQVEGKFYVWCVGVIYYNDIFQTGLTDQPHATHFCIFGEWSNPLFRAWVLGNDAD